MPMVELPWMWHCFATFQTHCPAAVRVPGSCRVLAVRGRKRWKSCVSLYIVVLPMIRVSSVGGSCCVYYAFWMPCHHGRVVTCSSAVREIGNTQLLLLLVQVALPLLLVQNQLLAADPREAIGLAR